MKKKSIIYILMLLSSICVYSQGTELITNGTFDNSDYWTIITEGEWVISGGDAHFEDLGTGHLRQNADDMVSQIQNNTTYILGFEITPDTTGGVAYMRIYDDINSNIYVEFTEYGVGSHQVIFTTPESNNGGISFYASSTQDGFTIDNISLIQGDEPAGSPYFISLTGHDANDGSISSPFATPERAFGLAKAGDSIYVRAGTYYRTQNQGSISVSVEDGTCNQGEPNNRIFFGGYPPDIANGDSVIFDFSLIMPDEPDYDAVEAGGTGETNGGFSFSWINYLTLKDFTVRNVWQKYRYVQVRGMNFYACNYLRIERVNVHHIGGQGVFSSNGTIDDTRYISSEGDTIYTEVDPYTITDSTLWIPGDTTYLINCDFYHCIDSFAVNTFNYGLGQAGSWAQPCFMVIAFPGEYIELNGCRSWLGADDGYNVQGPGTIAMIDCWSFSNGIYFPYLDYTSSGNGYKINNTGDTAALSLYPDLINRINIRCIASYNQGVGFTENHVQDQPSMNRNIYNNLAYKNEQGFTVTQTDPDGWEHRDNRYINNIGYDNSYADKGEYMGGYFETDSTNSWNDPPGVTVTDADFLALPDSATNFTILSAPRQSDGSLPDIGDYYKLAPISQLIDAGTDVGIDYEGDAPDLGPFEYTPTPSQRPNRPRSIGSKNVGGKAVKFIEN